MSKGKEIVAKLFDKYYGGEKARQAAFTALSNWCRPKQVLYPGGFIHINASFEFPSVTYVDNDKNAKKFFNYMDDVTTLVSKQKVYEDEPELRFYGQSYEIPIDEPDESYDLIISLYAGFISKPCKRYLKKGGVLAVNNSHGDAGLASIDSDLKFIGVIKGSGENLKVCESKLDDYFHPKKDIQITEELLRDSGRGVGYTKTAPLYLFRKK
ncbi:MAG: hypothetical protein HON90_12605 [Halobacteriovoraceae bacterium]|jgi:hypothetical protein|nr:hypothetical protein [Halobacteriovoraceae bacterium]